LKEREELKETKELKEAKETKEHSASWVSSGTEVSRREVGRRGLELLGRRV
jgi:hypothetical protein